MCVCVCVCVCVVISYLHRGRTLESTLGDRGVEKASVESSTAEFEAKTVPTLLAAKEVGNMYTASLYGGLASLLAV